MRGWRSGTAIAGSEAPEASTSTPAPTPAALSHLFLALPRELVLPFQHALPAFSAIPRVGAELLDLVVTARSILLALRERVAARVGELFAVILETLTDVPQRGFCPEAGTMTLEIPPAICGEVDRGCWRHE